MITTERFNAISDIVNAFADKYNAHSLLRVEWMSECLWEVRDDGTTKPDPDVNTRTLEKVLLLLKETGIHPRELSEWADEADRMDQAEQDAIRAAYQDISLDYSFFGSTKSGFGPEETREEQIEQMWADRDRGLAKQAF